MGSYWYCTFSVGVTCGTLLVILTVYQLFFFLEGGGGAGGAAVKLFGPYWDDIIWGRQMSTNTEKDLHAVSQEGKLACNLKHCILNTFREVVWLLPS